jgi:hypothetical protein
MSHQIGFAESFQDLIFVGFALREEILDDEIEAMERGNKSL